MERSAPTELISRAELATYARAVGDVAAAALPDFVSILWKGSTHRHWEGPYDFLPGLSDVDVHIYRPGKLEDPWGLRRRVLAEVGPAPYNTPLQLLVLDADALPSWWTVLAYEVLHGSEPPLTIPTDEVLLQRDRIGLAESDRNADLVSTEIVGLADHELWPYLRSSRWMFPSTLNRIATVAGNPPRQVWAMNRTRVLALVADDPLLDGLRFAAIDYFEAALAAGYNSSGAACEAALRAGQSLLRKAGAWAARQPGAVVDRRGGFPPA